MRIIILSIFLFHSFSFAFFDKWGFVNSEICKKFKIDFVFALDKMIENDVKQKGLVYSWSDKEFKKTFLVAGEQSKKAGQAIDRALKGNCFKRTKACSDSVKKMSKEYLLISKYYSKLYSIYSSSEVNFDKLEMAKHRGYKGFTMADLKEIEDRILRLSKKGEYWNTKRDLAVKNKDTLITKLDYFCKPTEKVSL